MPEGIGGQLGTEQSGVLRQLTTPQIGHRDGCRLPGGPGGPGAERQGHDQVAPRLDGGAVIHALDSFRTEPVASEARADWAQ